VACGWWWLAQRADEAQPPQLKPMIPPKALTFVTLRAPFLIRQHLPNTQ
jgi:hypothetical protein